MCFKKTSDAIQLYQLCYIADFRLADINRPHVSPDNCMPSQLCVNVCVCVCVIVCVCVFVCVLCA